MNNTHYTLHNDKNDLLTYLLKVHRNASFGDQLDQDNSSPDAGFSARKASEYVWRPGSARTRWGSLSAPPNPLAAKGGLLLRGGDGKGDGGEEKGGDGKGGREREGREGTGRDPQWLFDTPLVPNPEKHWLLLVFFRSCWKDGKKDAVLTVYMITVADISCIRFRLLTRYIKELEKEVQARANGQVPVTKYVTCSQFCLFIVRTASAVFTSFH